MVGHHRGLVAVVDVQESLKKIYMALESGKLDIEDLAPRIKDLRSQISKLEQEGAKIKSDSNQRSLEISSSEIAPYVEDLRGLLERGPYIRRKGFLKSFIKRIEYNEDKGGKIEYSFPLVPTNDNKMASFEVLTMEQNGGVDGARTRDLLRDS
jgi:site-specific DNA recombinase